MLTQVNQVQTSVCPIFKKTKQKTSSHSCSGTVSSAMHARRVIGGEKRGRYSFRKCFHFDKGQNTLAQDETNTTTCNTYPATHLST